MTKTELWSEIWACTTIVGETLKGANAMRWCPGCDSIMIYKDNNPVYEIVGGGMNAKGCAEPMVLLTEDSDQSVLERAYESVRQAQRSHDNRRVETRVE